MEPNINVYNAAARVGISRRFIDEDLGLYVTDAVLPGSSFADVEVSGDRQGITERMPFKRIYDDVTLTFMVDKDYKVMKYFEAWIQLINPLHGDTGGKADNQVMTLNYPKDYKCTMSIVKFNKDHFQSNGGFLYYCYIRSWPLSISSVPVNYDSGSILKLNVTFRYERYVMENVTVGKIRSGWKGYSDSFDPWLGIFKDLYQQLLDTQKDKTVVETSQQQAPDYYRTDPDGTRYHMMTEDLIKLWVRAGIYSEKNGKYYDEYGYEGTPYSDINFLNDYCQSYNGRQFFKYDFLPKFTKEMIPFKC